jgi:hypothetical protein
MRLQSPNSDPNPNQSQSQIFQSQNTDQIRLENSFNRNSQQSQGGSPFIPVHLKQTISQQSQMTNPSASSSINLDQPISQTQSINSAPYTAHLKNNFRLPSTNISSTQQIQPSQSFQQASSQLQANNCQTNVTNHLSKY